MILSVFFMRRDRTVWLFLKQFDMCLAFKYQDDVFTETLGRKII